MPERITDPTKLPVQLNVNIPFYMREELHSIASKRGVSMNSLVMDALDAAYFADVKAATRDAGATS